MKLIIICLLITNIVTAKPDPIAEARKRRRTTPEPENDDEETIVLFNTDQKSGRWRRLKSVKNEDQDEDRSLRAEDCRQPNEEYSTCGTSCPLTCDNYKKPPACNLMCNKGCFCMSGFVRDPKRNNACVAPENCS